MSYKVKIKESEITSPLPINFRNKLQKLYDDNSVSGQFLILGTPDKDGFKLIFTREVGDDFDPIQDRINNGESLRGAILNLLADDMLHNDPQENIAGIINDITKVLRNGTATIEAGFVGEFIKSGLIGGTENEILPIRAEAHSDDRIIEVEFDVTPWFEQASDAEIKALTACGFGGDYPADNVIEFMNDLGHEDARRLFEYLENMRGTRNAPGFGCNVSEGDTKVWIAANRPHLEIYQ